MKIFFPIIEFGLFKTLVATKRNSDIEVGDIAYISDCSKFKVEDCKFKLGYCTGYAGDEFYFLLADGSKCTVSPNDNCIVIATVDELKEHLNKIA